MRVNLLSSQNIFVYLIFHCIIVRISSFVSILQPGARRARTCMRSLCLLFVYDHCFGNWVSSGRFCFLLGLLSLFLGLFSFGKVLASSAAEDSSKEPKNGSSDGAIATDADATAAGTYARLENQKDKSLQNARGDAKQSYESEGILPKAAAAGKDVEEPDAESERETSRADATGCLELLVALDALDAPVNTTCLFLVAPKAEVVDTKPVEGIRIVDADQIAPSVGKDGQDEGRRRKEARAEAEDAALGCSVGETGG